MRCVAPLAIALLLFAASTNAQAPLDATPSQQAELLKLVEQYFGRNISSCSLQHINITQFSVDMATCRNQANILLSEMMVYSLFPSTCPASCKQAFNTAGVLCAEQYLNFLATKFLQLYQDLNNGQLDSTSTKFLDALVTAAENNNVTFPFAISPSSSQADVLYIAANYYSLWASVCGSAMSTSGSEGMGRSLSTVLLALVMIWAMLLS